MKQFSFLIVLILFFSELNSQNKNNVDSLQNLLSETKDKKEIVDIYNDLSVEMLAGNADSAMFYAEKSLEMSQLINYTKGIANSYLSLGGGSIIDGNFNFAVDYLMNALKIFETENDSIGISHSYLKLGSTYFYLDDFEKALKYNILSLSFLKSENNSELRTAYNNIGLVYSAMNNADSALLYYQKSINISKDKGNRGDIIYELGNIANLYADNGNYTKAIDIYKEIIKLSKEKGDKNAVLICYINLSDTYKSIIEKEENKNVPAHYNLLSLNYGDSALVLAKEMNSLVFVSYGYQQLYLSYKNIGDYKKAFLNLESYLESKDSLFNLEKIAELEKLEKQYHTEKQQTEIADFKKTKEFNEALIKKQNQAIFLGIIAIFIVFVLLIFLIILNKKKNTANKLLNEQYDSISSQRKEIAMQRDKLSELAFELKKTNKTKNKFISVLAHDLKNPFQAILGFSEILKDQTPKGDNGKTNKLAGYIYDTAVNTHTLLENLLEWAKAQTGMMKYKPKNILLSGLIEDSIKIVKNTAETKNIDLSVECDQTIEAYIDKSMISTVIRNLVSNAIKFTERNGAIKIISEISNNNINLIVKDNGIGIKEKTRLKLFKVDLNVSTTGTENETGTGLGLSVCKDFVLKNNGTITVKSKPGEGSKFTIVLPKAK